jgi:hypothetical protein
MKSLVVSQKNWKIKPIAGNPGNTKGKKTGP